jgi:hypothetical protein
VLTHRVRSRGLRPAGLPGDDDLINGEDGADGLGGELDRPVLGDEQVKNALFFGIQDTRAILVL